MNYLGNNLTSNTYYNQPPVNKANEAEEEDGFVIINPKSPQLFRDNPEFEKKMYNYLDQACHGISRSEMNEMLCRGEEIETVIKDCISKEQNSLPEDFHKSLTPNDAVCLIWLLMAKAGQQDKFHISGAFRIDDPNRLIFQFFKFCGKDNCYGRISTHMNENINKDKEDLKGQWGLDLRDQKLPSDKHTILFAAQPDDTLYIKIEESGCPPFWKTQHRSIKNMFEFMRHAIDYIITRITEKSKVIKETYRENVPDIVKKSFEKAMENLYTSSSSKTKDAQKEKKERILKGKMFGISEMYRQLKAAYAEIDKYQVEKEKAHEYYIPAPIKARYLEANILDYKGDVKGEEVLLPQLGRPIHAEIVKIVQYTLNSSNSVQR